MCVGDVVPNHTITHQNDNSFINGETMPAHPDRVRKHYNAWSFLDFGGRAMFEIGRGILVGQHNSRVLRVTADYLLSENIDPKNVRPELQRFIIY